MRLRPATEADAEAAYAVMEARDRADLGVPDFTLADLREEWGFPHVDLDKDVVVGEEDDGAVVAYGILRRKGVVAVVHPEHEGKGWGTLLLRWAEGRGAERGDDFRRQWINETNESARRLLEAAGYEWVRSYARMGRALDSPVEEPRIPDGVRLRELDPSADAKQVYELDKAAFSGAPDFDEMSFEDFRREHLESHAFVGTMSFVAERDGEPVGFLTSCRWDEDVPPAGYVALLAVAPSAQRAGIGTALLLTAFRAYAEAALEEAALGVSMENPTALRIYEGAGMQKRFGFATYERPLTDEERASLDANGAPLESPPAAGD